MKVNSASPIFWDLKEIAESRQWTQFQIRTIGFFVFDKAASKQDIAPKFMYNLVKNGQTEYDLWGKKRLKWTPVNFKL